MKKNNSSTKTTSKNLEQKFDEGKEVLDYFDPSSVRVDSRRVNLDLPVWVIGGLDQEAERKGIARQALIKGWIVDKLDELNKSKKQV